MSNREIQERKILLKEWPKLMNFKLYYSLLIFYILCGMNMVNSQLSHRETAAATCQAYLYSPLVSSNSKCIGSTQGL